MSGKKFLYILIGVKVVVLAASIGIVLVLLRGM